MVLHRPVELAHLIGMYAPPQSCKRKTSNGSWSALMYSALVESSTPGHDGYPLALVPIMWTVWLGPFRDQVSKAWERPIAISIFRQQTWQELFSLTRDFKLSPQKREGDSVRSCTRPPRPCEPAYWPRRRQPHSDVCAPTVALTNCLDREPACVAVAVRCARPERRVFVSTYCPVC